MTYRRSLVIVVTLLTGMVLIGTALQASAQTAQRCFPETNQCISGSIRAYWEEKGGLAVFGYPITALRTETVGDWTGQAQWFQRDRLEDHGTQGVMAGRLGAYLLQLQDRSWTTFPQTSSAPTNCTYFQETKHTLCDPFLTYWKENGGLERFGYPITEPFVEAVGSSWAGKVQYFERRRMEWHPELTGSPVLLGLLGTEALDELAKPQPTPTPDTSDCVDDVLPDLRTAYQKVPFVERLGCPTGTSSKNIQAATQNMENGVLIWLDRGTAKKHIFAVVMPGPVFRHYLDTWDADEDEYELDMSAPSGRYTPRGGFGKVWMDDPTLRHEIGWAIEREEQERLATVQDFDGGTMVLIYDVGKIYVFGDPDENPSDVIVLTR